MTVRPGYWIDGETGAAEVIAGDRAAWRFRPHYHMGLEITLVTHGRVRLVVGSEEITAAAGDLLVIPPGLGHATAPAKSGGWGFLSLFLAGPWHRFRDIPSVPDAIARARAMLAEDPAEPLTVDQLAGRVGLSTGYLCRVFKCHLGISPHAYRMQARLQRAKELIRGSESLAGAACDTGFFDQSHMTREFVRSYGFTPGQYRRAWTRTA